MSPVHDFLPRAFLVLPPEGDRRFARVQRRARLAALRTLLTIAPAALPRALGQSLARLQSMLSELLAGPRPEPVLEAVGGVDVLTRLRLIERGLGRADEHLVELVPNLLISLGALGVQESLVWEQPVARVVDRRRRVALTFEPPAKLMVLVGGEVELALAGGERFAWSGQARDGLTLAPLHPCHPGLPAISLAEFDTNPLAMEEAHPDKQGNALDLGGRTAGEWTGAIAGALELVRAGVPTWWEELPLALERLVPVGHHPERHLSASFEEAPGLAYLSLHPEPLTMAEAIVHETQHGKLNLLRWFDPLLENGQTTWTRSPVRPDLRPLFGVLMAVHAFVPVAAMHAQLAGLDHPVSHTPHFQRRRREVLATNAEGLAVLEEKSEATGAGRQLLDALRATHDALAARA